MKRATRRIVAILCAFTMIAGLILSEVGNVAQASSIADEWNLFSSASGTSVVTGDGKLYYACDSANVVLPENSQNLDTLELSMKIWLEDNDAVTVMKNSYFELANETCDKKERWWFLSEHATFGIGMNEIRVPLSEAHSDIGTGEGSGEFALNEPIKYFRMYNIDTSTTAANSIKLYDVSLCEPDKYIAFNNSGYFQLTNPLREAPDTITTSIKADIRDAAEEEIKATTWPLLTTGTELEAASKLHNSNNAVTQTVDVPLVLHGGSGLTDEDFKRAIKEGISKVNIFTDINVAALKEAKNQFSSVDKGITDLIPTVVEAVKQESMKKMQLFR